MSRTAYLVVRRALDHDGGACEDQSGCDTGSRVPLHLFESRAAADAFAADRAAEARRTMNPFCLLGYFLPDDMPERLAGFTFPLACPKHSWDADWRTWWDLCQDLITDKERGAVWAALGATLPYEVVEVDVGDERLTAIPQADPV